MNRKPDLLFYNCPDLQTEKRKKEQKTLPKTDKEYSIYPCIVLKHGFTLKTSLSQCQPEFSFLVFGRET